MGDLFFSLDALLLALDGLLALLAHDLFGLALVARLLLLAAGGGPVRLIIVVVEVAVGVVVLGRSVVVRVNSACMLQVMVHRAVHVVRITVAMGMMRVIKAVVMVRIAMVPVFVAISVMECTSMVVHASIVIVLVMRVVLVLVMIVVKVIVAQIIIPAVGMRWQSSGLAVMVLMVIVGVVVISVALLV